MRIKKGIEEDQSMAYVWNGQELSYLKGTLGSYCHIMVKRGVKVTCGQITGSLGHQQRILSFVQLEEKLGKSF